MCAKQLLKEEVIAKGSCLVSASCVLHTQPHHMQFCLLQNQTILLKCAHSVHVFGHILPVLHSHQCSAACAGRVQWALTEHSSYTLCSSRFRSCVVVARSRAPSACTPRAPQSSWCSTSPTTMPWCTGQLWPALASLACH